jgi:hypothetical protein
MFGSLTRSILGAAKEFLFIGSYGRMRGRERGGDAWELASDDPD